MIRNLKVLGLAVMAVLALSAIGAAGAQAAPAFTSEVESTTIITTPDGTGKTAHQVFDAAGASITCNKVTGAATQSGKSAAEVESTSIGYSECNFVGQTATVNMNGCNYNFEAGGNVDINCPAGKEITFSVPNPVCDVVVPSQQNKGTVTYHNIETAGSKEITVSPNVSGIKYTATGVGCPTVGTFENGTYTTGNVNLTGQDHTGATVGIEWHL